MVSVSPSASWLVTVAVSVWPVVGELGLMETVSTTGAVLVCVTVQLKLSVSVSVPSETVMVTAWRPAEPAARVPVMAPVVAVIVSENDLE